MQTSETSYCFPIATFDIVFFNSINVSNEGLSLTFLVLLNFDAQLIQFLADLVIVFPQLHLFSFLNFSSLSSSSSSSSSISSIHFLASLNCISKFLNNFSCSFCSSSCSFCSSCSLLFTF